MNTPPKPNTFAATHHMHTRQGLPVPEVEPLERSYAYVELVGCGLAIGHIPGTDYSLSKKSTEMQQVPALDSQHNESLDRMTFVCTRVPNDPLEPLDVDPATSAAITAVWKQAERDVVQILRDAKQHSQTTEVELEYRPDANSPWEPLL